MDKKYYGCTVKYTKINDKGNDQTFTDLYMVQAVSYTDAETRLHLLVEEGKISASREWKVGEIIQQNIVEVVRTKTPIDIYYECKVAVEHDEKTKFENYLIEGDAIRQVLDIFADYTSTWVVDTEVHAVKKTKVLDVFNIEE